MTTTVMRESATVQRYRQACDFLLVSNDISRYDLVSEALRRARSWTPADGELAGQLLRKRDELRTMAYRDGKDPEEITGWRWSS